MARYTGTKNITPENGGGNFTVSTPGGDIVLITSSTGKVILTANVTGTPDVPRLLDNRSEANVGNPNGILYDPGDIYDTPENRQAGSAYFAGGVGIEKDLNVGGFIYGRITFAITSTQLTVSSTNTDDIFYPTFTKPLSTQSGVRLFGDNTSDYGLGLTYNPGRGLLTSDKMVIDATDKSLNNPDLVAFRVKGGSFLEKDVSIGNTATNSTATLAIYGDIVPKTDQQWSIGSSTASWQSAWLENIYSKLKLTIAPGAEMTEIRGDIRVLGQNPIGTAPVVSNVLYVTMDGNDTNDGRAQDASRACRTVGGAIKSPYYQPGTQIRVSAGHYLEDNPLRLKPYTSVMGSDIRTTSIEPINKTQDLFHVDTGCYLAFMQFCNG